MGCGFGPEFWYSLTASCGVVRLFSTRPRVCVEWVGDSFVPFRPVGLVGILVPRRPPGLAGFVGPRTLKRRVAALGSRRGARARRLYGGGILLV